MSSLPGNAGDDLGLVELALRLEESTAASRGITDRLTGRSALASSAIRASIAARSSGVNGRW